MLYRFGLLTNLIEVMWNDIDLYHAVRDFTTDPDSYPIEEVKQFIQELVCPSTSTIYMSYLF